MSLSNNGSKSDRLQNGNNLLHTCTNLSEAKHLISHGVNVNHKNFSGRAPIHSLMRLDNPGARSVILYLLQLRIRHETVYVNLTEPDGTTFAHLCEWGPIMSALAHNKHFNPNKIRPCDGNTPLMYCITYPKHPDIAKRLLEDPRIDLTICNPINGKTALELAEESTTEYGQEILKLILCKINSEFKASTMAPCFVATSKETPSLLEMTGASQIDSNAIKSSATPKP